MLPFIPPYPPYSPKYDLPPSYCTLMLSIDFITDNETPDRDLIEVDICPYSKSRNERNSGIQINRQFIVTEVKEETTRAAAANDDDDEVSMIIKPGDTLIGIKGYVDHVVDTTENMSRASPSAIKRLTSFPSFEAAIEAMRLCLSGCRTSSNADTEAPPVIQHNDDSYTKMTASPCIMYINRQGWTRGRTNEMLLKKKRKESKEEYRDFDGMSAFTMHPY